MAVSSTSEMEVSRFASPVTDSMEEKQRLTGIPEKTKSVTAWGMRVWSDWAAARAALSASSETDRLIVTTPLLEMPVEDLAYWMGKFVLEARKTDGSEYPPKTLYALVCCFKRYYVANGVHDVNPLDPADTRFGGFRQTLDAEMQRLHAKGLGTKKKQAEPITPDEEAMLWAIGQMGCRNAQALVNTVYFYNCKVFGLRSYDEHHRLQCKQFEKKLDEFGRLYLEYTDYGSKTNRGGLKHMKVDNKSVRQYENPEDPEHCVVNIFERYFSLIPSREGCFYFRPLPNDTAGTLKFAKQTLGRNTFAKLIPNMCKAAGIEGYKTGHSGKVTCATTLYHQGFTDQLIKERTGHRSLEALHAYKRTGSKQQQELSLALAPITCTSGNKENKRPTSFDEDEDDFVPLKKKPKAELGAEGKMQGLFPRSCMNNCTFNITFQK